MSSLEEMRRIVRDGHQRMTLAALPEAVVQDSADLPANKVRVYRLDIRKNVVVNGFKFQAGLHVYLMMMPDHEWQMLVPAIGASTLVFGEGVGAITIPPGAQETVPWSIPPLGLTEARLQASEATDDPLKVHTGAFMYQGQVHLGGSFDGAGNFDPTAYDATVAAYVPDTTGYTRWVGRYFDPSDATFHFVPGALEFWPSVAYLSEETLGDLEIPVGCYWCGAVALTYGQTTVQGGRFASWREFIGRKGGADFDLIVTDADRQIVVDADGNVVVSNG